MPHVTGHFRVCHVELWLLFSRLFSLYTSVPCTGVPGPKIHQYPGAWVPRHTTVPRIQSPTQKTYSYTRKVKIATRSEKSATTRKVAGKSSEKARKFQQNAFLGSRRHWVLGTGYWVLGTGYWVLGTGYWVLGTGYWVLGTGYWVLGTGYWVLGTGYWVLGTGYWVLGTGYWVLGTGYWVLGTGYWAPRESTLKAAKAQVTGKTRYVIMFNFQLLVKIEQKNAAYFNLFVFSTRNKRVMFTLLNSYFFTHQSFCVTS